MKMQQLTQTVADKKECLLFLARQSCVDQMIDNLWLVASLPLQPRKCVCLCLQNFTGSVCGCVASIHHMGSRIKLALS